MRQRALGGRANAFLVETVGKADAHDAKGRKRSVDENLRAAIERAAVQDRFAGAHISEHCGGDGRHAGRKHQSAFGFFMDRQPVFDDFEVRMVEARINQAGWPLGRRRAASGEIVEEIAALLGGLENKCRSQKHRRLDRTFRKNRVISIAEHQRFGIELVVSDFGLVIAGGVHDEVPSQWIGRQSAAGSSH